MMYPYEEPTLDFRQVARERRLPRSGDCVTEYKVQRKWLVHDIDLTREFFPKIVREEWRDVPIVDEKDV